MIALSSLHYGPQRFFMKKTIEQADPQNYKDLSQLFPVHGKLISCKSAVNALFCCVLGASD